MSDAKEGVVLDREGRVISTPSETSRPNDSFHHKFSSTIGNSAMRFTAASWPGKIILSVIALIMLGIGGAVILIAVFFFLIRLVFRMIFGRR